MTMRLIGLLAALTVVGAACGTTPTTTAVDMPDELPADAAQTGDAATGTAGADGANGADPVEGSVLPDEEATLAALASSMSDDEFPVEVELCFAKEAIQRPSIAATLITASDELSLDEFTLDEQLALFEMLGVCAGPELLGAHFLDGFTDGTDIAEVPPSVGACFGEAAVAEDGPEFMVALAAVGDSTGVPVETHPAAVAALTECVPPSVLAGWVYEGMVEDPVIAAGADEECVLSAFDEVDLTPLWSQFLDNPKADPTALPQEDQMAMLGPLFECVSFGEILAVMFAADGVVVAPSTVECMDAALTTEEYTEWLLFGSDNDNEPIERMLSCLSADELEQLQGA
ncbi:MAG: hypothetical protein AAF467_23160 [Actinomycetota bacterium]